MDIDSTADPVVRGGGGPLEQAHLEESSEFHRPNFRRGPIGEIRMRQFLGRAREDPTADPDIIQDLQQPFSFGDSQLQAAEFVSLAEALRIGEEGIDQGFIFFALFGQGIVEEFLICVAGGRRGFGDAVVCGRNDGILTEQDDKQFLLAFVEMEHGVIVFNAEEFHSSRSMVACRLYFWS
jgi:hypothetical protein